MARVRKETVIYILDELIGPVVSTGDAEADKEIEKNMATLTGVMTWCADRIIESASTDNFIGRKAQATLKVYRDWLRDVTEEVDSGKEK